MKAFIVSIIMYFFTLSCCSSRRLIVSDIDGPRIELKINSKTSKELFGRWMNSFEEEKPNGESIYRPQSYNFPLSKNRFGIEILPNGTFFEILPSETGMANKIVGNWIFTSKTNSIDITFPSKNKPSDTTSQHETPKPYTLLLLFVDKDLLKVKKIAY